MKSYTRLLLIFCLLSAAVGCQPELPAVYAPESILTITPEQEFDVFWNGMNNNYVFWDIDPTDWDAVRRTYKPLFAQLTDTQEDQKKARTYYEEMTANLIDSHYELRFTDGTIQSPSNNRITQRPTFHKSFEKKHFTKVIPANYLAENSLIGTGTDDNGTQDLVAGKLKNTNILYFHFSSFSLGQWYQQKTESAAIVIQYVLDELQKSDLDGIIIDVRNNGGGSASDLDFLVGQLTDKPYVFGTLRSKAGMGRLDYLPWISALVNPPAGTKAFTKPVVVLADMFSVSMAEITSMAIKALPSGNGKIVGERTWGGQGPLIPNQMLNGGQFNTSTSIRQVYTSSQMFRYKDGKIYEGIGFPPDVEAPYDGQALKIGKDTQLEKAIAQIR